MADFTVRVELHGASRQDYDNLHGFMEQAGFGRIVQADDGRWYELPTAEYAGRGDVTVGQARDIALAAARQTGRDCWVLVTQSVGRAWYLSQVR